MKRKAIYPGTFDPVTNGHLDVIKRALEIFDIVYVAVACNHSKNTLFSADERLTFLREVTADLKGIEVEIFDGLIVNYAKLKQVKTIIRGLRAISDFDYEFQMALTNRKLAPSVETVFLMPSEDNFYISSRLIKEISALGGKTTQFVSKKVARALKRKLGEAR